MGRKESNQTKQTNKHPHWYKTEGQEIVPIRLKMVDWDEKYQSKQTFFPMLSTGSAQVDPSRQD